MPPTQVSPVDEFVKEVGLPAKTGKVTFAKGKFWFTSGRTKGELPTTVADEKELGKLVGKKVTALVSGTTVVAVLPPLIARREWRPLCFLCYVPARPARANRRNRSGGAPQGIHQREDHYAEAGGRARHEAFGTLKLKSIILEVTQACNHACAHCYNYWFADRAPVTSRSALSRAEILCLMREIRSEVDVLAVAISGGEPLLRKDLGGIVSDLAGDGLEVTVITNGTFLSASRLRSFPADVLFELTLLAPDPATHDGIAGRAGAFRDVVRAAVAVHQHKAGLAIACVVCRSNVRRMARTLELAAALGANGIAINRVNLGRHTLASAPLLVPSIQELRQALDGAEAVASRLGMTFAISVPIPLCVVDPSPYRHLHFGWCPRGGPDAYYTVSYDGTLRPCNHSSTILGDLRRQSFREIVSSHNAQEYWRGMPPECVRCDHPLRDSCAGGCPAASHECFGTANRIDPFVEFACSAVTHRAALSQ